MLVSAAKLHLFKLRTCSRYFSSDKIQFLSDNSSDEEFNLELEKIKRKWFLKDLAESQRKQKSRRRRSPRYDPELDIRDVTDYPAPYRYDRNPTPKKKDDIWDEPKSSWKSDLRDPNYSKSHKRQKDYLDEHIPLDLRLKYSKKYDEMD